MKKACQLKSRFQRKTMKPNLLLNNKMPTLHPPLYASSLMNYIRQTQKIATENRGLTMRGSGIYLSCMRLASSQMFATIIHPKWLHLSLPFNVYEEKVVLDL